MFALCIILGVLMGLTVLLVMCLVAGLLVALLYELAPIVRAWDVDLSQPVFLTRWRAVKLPEQPPVDVVKVMLCREPLLAAEYFYAATRGEPLFTKCKHQALRFSLADRLAIKMYFRKFGGETNVFVVYAEERRSDARISR